MTLYQPWQDHPIHRESTYSLVMRAVGKHCGTNPTIFSDSDKADEHERFMDWLYECRIRFWEMSADEFEAVKDKWRKA